MIINMILSACIAWVWVYPLRMIRFKYKPLNCEVCMAGWIAAVYCWSEWHTPLYMAGAMVIVVIITRFLNK
jgi:hypothetical protein